MIMLKNYIVNYQASIMMIIMILQMKKKNKWVKNIILKMYF